MKTESVIEKILISFIAFVIALIITFLVFFFKILVPSIVIAYIFKMKLINSIAIYLLFLLLITILKNILNRVPVKDEELTPLEDILD